MTEETFVRELERHADDVHGVPLTLETVRGRARQIRRRRRTAAAVGVAAAVAAVVLVPAALTGGGSERAPEPAPPLTAPGSSVLHDGVVTKPDGETVRLDVDNADVTQLGVLTDGRIVLAVQRPSQVRVYAADGSLDATYPVRQNVFSMSPRDDAAAWVAKDLTVRVLASGTTEPATWARIPRLPGTDGNISAVIDPGHLLVDDGTATSVEMTSAGESALTTPEPFRVVDVSPDRKLWAVSFVPDADHEQFGCSGLYEPETGTVVARSCDVGYLEFAPDGQHLMALRGDNNMFGEASTYDLDLQEIGRYASAGKGDVISRAAWADATHLVVARTDWKTSTWSLERVDLTWDDPEVVVPEAPGRNPESVQEFVLSE
ncbi:hypothetical protein KM427_06890 [Nocardioides sp. LMS-CY]|uniref:hypothetical protein n=1 Tax=Nocardioides sp. (strain LMS-CY) TaxID=2840457 RepID=UPI001C005B07|nr:hypothetical protein [Nocardioides sp. LMS-CY]QWF23440.1 hypothetical protein KM427_06890 [Nocardioides sp. LMS-CY]